MNTISRSNIKRFLLAASVALALPLGVMAYGDPHPGGHRGCGPMGGEMMSHHLKALNLTEAQRDKVFEIMHTQAPAMRDKAKALRKTEDDLRALSASADYSDAKAKALAEASARAMADMSLARARSERQIYELLTPEQRKQLAEMKPLADASHGRGHGEGRMTPSAR